MQKMSRKSIFVLILLAAILLLFPTFVHAADSESSITYTKEFPGSDGTIIVNLKGLNLDETGDYVYYLTTQGGSVPEEDKDWVNISEYTTATARIELQGTMGKFTETIAKTNRAIIWIKKTGEASENAIKINVDLTLAPETVPNVTGLENGKLGKESSSFSYNAYSAGRVDIEPLYGYFYNDIYDFYKCYLTKVEYEFVKVTDKNGNAYFTRTGEEHSQKINELQSQGLWVEF